MYVSDYTYRQISNNIKKIKKDIDRIANNVSAKYTFQSKCANGVLGKPGDVGDLEEQKKDLENHLFMELNEDLKLVYAIQQDILNSLLQ